MRRPPDALEAALREGGAVVARAWILTRADGVRLGFTDHDEDVVVDAVRCAAATGWTAGAAHTEQGLSPGLASATGALATGAPATGALATGALATGALATGALDSAALATGALDSAALDSAALSEADITAGLYDGASVDHYRVAVGDTVAAQRIWRGVISRLVRAGAGFTAELEGPIEALTRVVGRTYGRTCDAILGDARCGVPPQAAGVALGCDKRFETCRDRFANGANFRGFPDIPGDDFLAVTPQSGAANDGGSRR